jgi:outer membrane immunogenic protein
MKKIALSAAAISLLFVGAASAADMAVKAPPPPVAPVMTWTGFYVGFNVGGAWDNSRSVDTRGQAIQGFTDGIGPASFAGISAAAASSSGSFGNDGHFIGGGQIGYNWQFGRGGVVGFEADIAGLDQRTRTAIVNNTTAPFNFFGGGEVINSQITTSRTLDYIGTIRGRVGLLATPALLLYVTGGGAYGGARASTAITQSNNDCVLHPGNCITPTSTTTLGSGSTTLFGWTAGVGGEWMFAPNWSAKAEYLYYDLGSVRYNSTVTTLGSPTFQTGNAAVVNVQSTANLNGSIARVGVNYHFGGPIVARY